MFLSELNRFLFFLKNRTFTHKFVDLDRPLRDELQCLNINDIIKEKKLLISFLNLFCENFLLAAAKAAAELARVLVGLRGLAPK